MSILLDRVDEERIKLDLTGAGFGLSQAWNKMLEKVKKANSNGIGNEYFIVDLIVACDNGGLTSYKYKAEISVVVRKEDLYIVGLELAKGEYREFPNVEYSQYYHLHFNNVDEKRRKLMLTVQTIGDGIGSDFDPKESNYGKVIIMTDADDDGAHIQILLITFFYRFMKGLIENGMLYIANPPLYSIEYNKTKEYIQSDEELAIKRKEIKGAYKINRFKGLGEMDAEELFETTMDPKHRSLIKVNIEDAMLAEKRVSVLMGDKVEPRKEWINENVDFTLEDDFRR